MRLGIVVTDVNQAEIAAELLRDAAERKWQVRCFLTDDGVNMIKDDGFIALSRSENVHLSVCEHSVERFCSDFDLGSVEGAVIVGGQYQDAELVHNSDRVLVF